MSVKKAFAKAYRDMRLGADLDRYHYPDGYNIARAAWEALAARSRADNCSMDDRLAQYKALKVFFPALAPDAIA